MLILRNNIEILSYVSFILHKDLSLYCIMRNTDNKNSISPIYNYKEEIKSLLENDGNA